MNAVLRLPRIDGRRYIAAKRAVRERCAYLGLCADATARCVDRAAAMVREGRSAALASSEGITLAKRLAGLARARNGDAA